MKHAGAQQVHVRLRALPHFLELRLRDDGGGLPPDGRAGGQGLANMQMRARAVGGDVAFFDATPGTGLLVRLPL